MKSLNGPGPSPKSKNHLRTICEFLGIAIRIHYNEGIHSGRAHFHVVAPDFEVSIDIETGEELSLTKLPPGRRSRLIRKWARENREALMENWRLAREGKAMKQLRPPRH